MRPTSRLNERTLTRRWILVAVMAVSGAFFSVVLALRLINDQARVPVGPSPEQLITELRRTGRPVQALYLVETAALDSGWTATRLRLAGDLWREIGDPYNAAAYWERAAIALPDDQGLIRDLAETYVTLGDWTHAADALDHLHRLAPDDRWTAYQLGMIRAAVDPQAIDLLQTAALEPAYAPIVNPVIQTLRDADPNSSPSERALSIGVAMAEAEQYAYAELAFSQLVGDPQVGALALAYTGWTRDMQGKDGSSDIRRAVALAPDDARVRYLQGLHERQRADFAAAIAALQEAVALDPARAETYAELGVTYAQAGDHENARNWLQTALDMSNNDPRYQSLMDALDIEETDLLTRLGFDASALTGESTAEPTSEVTPEHTSNPIAP